LENILKVNGLKKYFRTPNGMLHAVDDLSFTINKGEIMGVVGESGCGKSTLGRTVIGLLDATDGQIVFEDKDITHIRGIEKTALRRKMQMIFQDPYSSLNPRMTVSEAIAEGMIVHKMYKSKKELNKRVAELMDTVGLASRLAMSYPHELDGGRRQRIGIARALCLNPKFIVCDEPVSALDVSVQAQVLNLMQNLQEEKGLTYMFITHDLSVVKHISDNIMVMYLGKMVEMCQSDELFEHTLHPYTKALLSAIPTTDIKQRAKRILLKGEISSPINPKEGCRFAARCSYAHDVCNKVTPEIREMLPNHFVACHFVESINDLK
jgi:oligopeptide/dipeptide ABC transporter ATP-binding protein